MAEAVTHDQGVLVREAEATDTQLALRAELVRRWADFRVRGDIHCPVLNPYLRATGRAQRRRLAAEPKPRKCP